MYFKNIHFIFYLPLNPGRYQFYHEVQRTSSTKATNLYRFMYLRARLSQSPPRSPVPEIESRTLGMLDKFSTSDSYPKHRTLVPDNLYCYYMSTLILWIFLRALGLQTCPTTLCMSPQDLNIYSSSYFCSNSLPIGSSPAIMQN